jgi:putative transposase
MSEKYKIIDSIDPHFVTFTVVGWIDVFSREYYKEIITESLQYCTAEKGLILNAWIIMTNHIHLIIRSDEANLSSLVRDMKKYTSKQIVDAIKLNSKESRRNWLIKMFKCENINLNKSQEYQFWRKGYHPVCLSTSHMINQRLNYLHQNPVKSGLVWEPWHYKYSSAIDYYTNEKGLLTIEKIE